MPTAGSSAEQEGKVTKRRRRRRGGKNMLKSLGNSYKEVFPLSPSSRMQGNYSIYGHAWRIIVHCTNAHNMPSTTGGGLELGPHI